MIQKRLLSAIIVLWSIGMSYVHAAEMLSINVADLGARVNDKDFNSALPIWEKVKEHMLSGQPLELVFDEGVYYMGKTNNHVASLFVRPQVPGKAARNLHFRGVPGKTVLMVTESIGCIRLDEATDCSIKNITIDYLTPPYSQGEVVAIDKKSSTIRIKVDPGFPAPMSEIFAKKEWGILWDKEKREPKSTNFDHTWVTGAKQVKGQLYDLQMTEPWRFKYFDIGDWFILTARQKNPTATAFWNCKNILVKDVIVHASPGITSGIVMCEGMHFDGWQVRVKENSGRLHSSNGDGLHFHGNRSGPIIENCYFEGLLDDGVNINIHETVIQKIENDRILTVPFRKPVIQKAGDQVQIFDPKSGEVLGLRRIKDVKALSREQLVITLDKAFPGLTTEHVFYNLNGSSKGYIIRNNTFKKQRRFGLLIRAGEGLIENNTFDRCYGTGINISNEAFLEGPLGQNIIVRNNTLNRVGRTWHSGGGDQGGAICILSYNDSHKMSGFQNYKNIQLINNTIIDPPRYGLCIDGAENVLIKDLVVKKGKTDTYYKDSAGIMLRNASKIRIDNFKHQDDSPHCKASVIVEDSVATGSAGVSIKKHDAQLSAEAQVLVDRR